MIRKTLLSLPVLLLIFSMGVNADSPYRNNWFLDVGAYWTNIDSHINYKGDHLSGVRFDVEDILGLEDSSTEPYVQAMYRFNDRHALEFSYIDLDRNGEQVLSVRLSPEGDDTYAVGAAVKSHMRSQVFRIGYRYALFTDADKNLEIGAGLHVTRFSFSIEALAGINGKPLVGSTSDTRLTAPLPAIGLKGAYRFGDDFLLKANFDFFVLSIENYAGDLINSGAYLEYDMLKYMGVGAGYQYNRIRLDSDRDDLRGDAEYTYHGPIAYVSFFY